MGQHHFGVQRFTEYLWMFIMQEDISTARGALDLLYRSSRRRASSRMLDTKPLGTHSSLSLAWRPGASDRAMEENSVDPSSIISISASPISTVAAMYPPMTGITLDCTSKLLNIFRVASTTPASGSHAPCPFAVRSESSARTGSGEGKAKNPPFGVGPGVWIDKIKQLAR